MVDSVQKENQMASQLDQDFAAAAAAEQALADGNKLLVTDQATLTQIQQTVSSDQANVASLQAAYVANLQKVQQDINQILAGFGPTPAPTAGEGELHR
jgi:hypothetical protein